MNEPRRGRVFISHSSGDRRRAEDLLTELEVRGIKAWVSFRDIAEGDVFDAAISRAITGAKAMVVLVTERSLDSQNVLKEFAIAEREGVRVIPLASKQAVVDAAMAVPAWGYHLIRTQVLVCERADEAAQRIADALGGVVVDPPVGTMTHRRLRRTLLLAVPAMGVLIAAAAVMARGGDDGLGSASSPESLPFSVIDHYDPSGLMGDIGDITATEAEGVVRFEYETLGRGAHEWEWKYVEGAVNDLPARFGGVMLLNPPGNWGTMPDGAYDLRGAQRISWRACNRIDEAVYVEFLIGGVTWRWGEQRTMEPAPFPDSMPRTSLGTRLIEPGCESFEHDLSDVADDGLAAVLGGFGWVVSATGNGIEWEAGEAAPVIPRTIVLEIDQIVYDR